jgi:2-phosphoglycerate kinase
MSHSWHVLLVGGASGSGKTMLARRLGRRYGVNVTQLDDIQAALTAVTTPQEKPLLHFWRTNWDEFSAFTDDQHLAHFLEISRTVFGPIIEAIVADRLGGGDPAIVEGDFVLPDLAVRAAFAGEPARDRVRGLFVGEEDEECLAQNFSDRQGGDNALRARTSRVKAHWLRRRCEALSVPWISSRPWESTADRAIEALRRGAS